MFDDLFRKLDDFQRRAERLHGEHEVPISELFPDTFMLLNTDFGSFDQLIAAGGFEVHSTEDFAAIPDDEWEEHIREHTRFQSWEEMQGAAAQEWAGRQLGLE